MVYKACIFDLDGTLVNSLQDLALCVNLALGQQGYPAHTEDEFRYIVGRGAKKMVEGALPAGLSESPEIVGRTLELFRRHYAVHYRDKTKPYAGIVPLLEALKKKGIRLAVISNKPDDFVKKIVLELFGKDLFYEISGQRKNIPTKPNPAGAIAACSAMNVSPCECAFIGDSNVDMETAVAARMMPVGALWGFRSREELERAGAELLLTRPEDLLALFGGK